MKLTNRRPWKRFRFDVRGTPLYGRRGCELYGSGRANGRRCCTTANSITLTSKVGFIARTGHDSPWDDLEVVLVGRAVLMY